MVSRGRRALWDSIVFYCKVCYSAWTESFCGMELVKAFNIVLRLCLLLKFCIFPVWQLLIVSTLITDFLHASYFRKLFWEKSLNVGRYCWLPYVRILKRSSWIASISVFKGATYGWWDWWRQRRRCRWRCQYRAAAWIHGFCLVLYHNLLHITDPWRASTGWQLKWKRNCVRQPQ